LKQKNIVVVNLPRDIIRLSKKITRGMRWLLIRLPLCGQFSSTLVVRDDVANCQEVFDLWVQPQKILGSISSTDLSRADYWFVQQGIWRDDTCKKVETSGKYRLFREILDVGVARYEKADEFNKILKVAKDGIGYKTNHNNHGIARSRDQICAYIEKQVALAQQMSNVKFWTDPQHAIPVVLGPTGSLYRIGDGKHRHVFAMLLMLPVVRVQIVNIHKIYIRNQGGCFLFCSGLYLVKSVLAKLKDQPVASAS
jgi:hypothetical protein